MKPSQPRTPIIKSKNIPIALALFIASITAGIGLHSHQTLAAGADPSIPNTMLVLDGSGSMWGKIKGGHKVMIARKAISSAIRPFDDKINLGLIAFGHRRRGACFDIQTIDRLTPLNATQFTRLVNQIKPLGKTPIGGALKKATKLLTATKRGGTIILLVDGPENCRQNPCALITPAFSKKNKIKVHVIAFSMEKKQSETLRCIAKNSGGQFHTPNDAASLEVALKTAFNAQIKAAPKPQKQPLAKKKRIKPHLSLSAHLGPNSNPLKTNLSWKIIKLTNSGSPDTDLPPWVSTKSSPDFDLDPGNYRISTRFNDYEVTKNITLKKQQEQEEKLVFNLSELKLPAGWSRPDSRSGFGKLLFEPQTPTGQNQKTTVIELTANAQRQLIRAGAYKIIGIENGKIQTWFIHARPGQSIDLPIWRDTGRAHFTLIDADTGKPLNQPITRIFKISPKVEKHKKTRPILNKEKARSTAHTPQFDLSQGTYIALIKDGLVTKRHAFKISAAQLTNETIELQRTILKIDHKSLETQATSLMEILALDEHNQTHFLAEISDLTKDIILPPGNYRLILRTSPTAHAVEKDITLKSGSNKTIKFSTTEAYVSFVISNRSDPLSRHQIFWRLFDNKGSMIWQSTEAEPTMRLSQGKYSIAAEIGKDRFQMGFRINGSADQTLDLANNGLK